MRAAKLASHPYCQCPHHAGKRVRADHPDFGGAVVDHDPPHKGDERAFWDTRRLRSMTKLCHDSAKQRQEKSGIWPGCDEHGWPTDPAHDWNE